jgi:hypothetical protein
VRQAHPWHSPDPFEPYWGLAIDIKISGELVPLAADYCLEGLLDLYGYMHEEGWYWGAGFHRPDPMHFEIADETLSSWSDQGLV